jgi:hypothetical protein
MKSEGRAQGVRCTGIAHGYDQTEKEIKGVYDHNSHLNSDQTVELWRKGFNIAS